MIVTVDVGLVFKRRLPVCRRRQSPDTLPIRGARQPQAKWIDVHDRTDPDDFYTIEVVGHHQLSVHHCRHLTLAGRRNRVMPKRRSPDGNLQFVRLSVPEQGFGSDLDTMVQFCLARSGELRTGSSELVVREKPWSA
jgi:hypothetical protein